MKNILSYPIILLMFLCSAQAFARCEVRKGVWSFEPFNLMSQNLMDDFSGDDVSCSDISIEIIRVESDAIPGATRLDLMRDTAGAITGLNCVAADGQSMVYALSQLRQKPQVIKKMDGYDVILVSVEKDFTAMKGGHAIMRFLTNGVVGAYKNFRMLVDLQGSTIVLRADSNRLDPDSDGNSYDSIFNHLFLSKNTVFGKVVGIHKVIPSQK